MTILRGAVRVARKPPEVLILDASRDLRRPIGHGADAVLLVVDGVLMLFNKLTRGGYRFLFALEIWKLETTLFLVLLPVPAQIQNISCPVTK